MHELETLLIERISSGLKRRSITSCSEWAETYRVMGQPYPGSWKFDHHPWLRDMHDCDAETIIGEKAAQMGYTEVALNRTFHAIDIYGTSVLYVLPAATPDASDFSTSRFDPALENSKHLQNLFSDVKNIGHKRAGNANLFIRGSRSRSQLKSIPVGRIIFDEVDEMHQENIPLALERASGQLQKDNLRISTPTIGNYGIDIDYQMSTQDHFFFKCPCCSKLTELVFPECLIITSEDFTSPDIMDSHLICKECQGVLSHESKIDWLSTGKWVPGYTNRLIHGYHINQLYSMTEPPYKIAISFLKSQINQSDEQEFYNSKLGLPHAVEGAQINDDDINQCIGSHRKKIGLRNKAVTMGIDVGKFLHVEITEWILDPDSPSNDINLISKARVINELKVLNFEELDALMQDYQILFAVIDANPERRKALEFAQRFPGNVKLCFYGRGVSGKNINIHSEEEHTITVDRTSWLDLSLSRFKSKRIILPVDLSLEYRRHIKAPVRIYEKDTDGNAIGKYIKGKGEDHYAHARTYSEIALRLGISLSRSENMGSVL